MRPRQSLARNPFWALHHNSPQRLEPINLRALTLQQTTCLTSHVIYMLLGVPPDSFLRCCKSSWCSRPRSEPQTEMYSLWGPRCPPASGIRHELLSFVLELQQSSYNNGSLNSCNWMLLRCVLALIQGWTIERDRLVSEDKEYIVA
jgi:hypothetical protein